MNKRRRIQLLIDFSVPLLFGLVAALLCTNFLPSQYDLIVYGKLFNFCSLHGFINDIFMAFFFGIVTVEIVQSLQPGGDLYPVKSAFNSLISAFGGVVCPALIYYGLNTIIGSPELIHGWGIPTATDIALAWLAARFIFGSKHPAVKFLLVLAIADDAIGLFIIAVFYPDPTHPVKPVFLILVAIGMTAAYMFRRMKVKTYLPYIFFGGTLCWLGLFLTHLHPALALCFVVPFLPSEKIEHKSMFEESKKEKSPLSMFEHHFRIFVELGLFFFGFSSAGVGFSQFGTATILVFTALLFGKTIGVFTFSNLASICGFKRPKGIDNRTMLSVSIVAAMGLTVSLFISESAFPGNIAAVNAAKMGALISSFAGVIAFFVYRILHKEKNK
ncbi:MAG: Na+/H+ antiporter NhaA [Bacillota bacterium]|nr:Na+/H+ antiporter NhaA [Bacillota bacterium]